MTRCPRRSSGRPPCTSPVPYAFARPAAHAARAASASQDLAPPAAPPAAELAAGSGLPETPEPRYEILSELGRGGMGVVHKALDQKLDRHVALKILPWQLRGDETAMRYFKREAKAIAALKHPNVVALYDYGEGFGASTSRWSTSRGRTSRSSSRRNPNGCGRTGASWFVQATRGIAAAHAKGILHRDLKPANLILDEHGTLRNPRLRPRAPAGRRGRDVEAHRESGVLPPEVLRGRDAEPGVRRLLARCGLLHARDGSLAVRRRRRPRGAPRARSRRPAPVRAVPEREEVRILMRTLARHRPDRYPDGGELLAALLALEAG